MCLDACVLLSLDLCGYSSPLMQAARSGFKEFISCCSFLLGGQPGSAAMKAFWRALATVDFDGDLLQLPAGVYFLGLSRYGSRMMRREVHGQLMNIADDLLAKGCNALVVLGTPGSGKSW